MSKKGRKIPRVEQSIEEFLFEEGREARIANAPRESCPYIAGADIWQEGWDATDREIPRARAAAE